MSEQNNTTQPVFDGKYEIQEDYRPNTPYKPPPKTEKVLQKKPRPTPVSAKVIYAGAAMEAASKEKNRTFQPEQKSKMPAKAPTQAKTGKMVIKSAKIISSVTPSSRNVQLEETVKKEAIAAIEVTAKVQAQSKMSSFAFGVTRPENLQVQCLVVPCGHDLYERIEEHLNEECIDRDQPHISTIPIGDRNFTVLPLVKRQPPPNDPTPVTKDEILRKRLSEQLRGVCAPKLSQITVSDLAATIQDLRLQKKPGNTSAGLGVTYQHQIASTSTTVSTQKQCKTIIRKSSVSHINQPSCSGAQLKKVETGELHKPQNLNTPIKLPQQELTKNTPSDGPYVPACVKRKIKVKNASGPGYGYVLNPDCGPSQTTAGLSKEQQKAQRMQEYEELKRIVTQENAKRMQGQRSVQPVEDQERYMRLQEVDRINRMHEQERLKIVQEQERVRRTQEQRQIRSANEPFPIRHQYKTFPLQIESWHQGKTASAQYRNTSAGPKSFQVKSKSACAVLDQRPQQNQQVTGILDETAAFPVEMFSTSDETVANLFSHMQGTWDDDISYACASTSAAGSHMIAGTSMYTQESPIFDKSLNTMLSQAVVTPDEDDLLLQELINASVTATRDMHPCTPPKPQKTAVKSKPPIKKTQQIVPTFGKGSKAFLDQPDNTKVKYINISDNSVGTNLPAGNLTQQCQMVPDTKLLQIDENSELQLLPVSNTTLEDLQSFIDEWDAGATVEYIPETDMPLGKVPPEMYTTTEANVHMASEVTKHTSTQDKLVLASTKTQDQGPLSERLFQKIHDQLKSPGKQTSLPVKDVQRSNIPIKALPAKPTPASARGTVRRVYRNMAARPKEVYARYFPRPPILHPVPEICTSFINLHSPPPRSPPNQSGLEAFLESPKRKRKNETHMYPHPLNPSIKVNKRLYSQILEQLRDGTLIAHPVPTPTTPPSKAPSPLPRYARSTKSVSSQPDVSPPSGLSPLRYTRCEKPVSSKREPSSPSDKRRKKRSKREPSPASELSPPPSTRRKKPIASKREPSPPSGLSPLRYTRSPTKPLPSLPSLLSPSGVSPSQKTRPQTKPLPSLPTLSPSKPAPSLAHLLCESSTSSTSSEEGSCKRLKTYTSPPKPSGGKVGPPSIEQPCPSSPVYTIEDLREFYSEQGKIPGSVDQTALADKSTSDVKSKRTSRVRVSGKYKPGQYGKESDDSEEKSESSSEQVDKRTLRKIKQAEERERSAILKSGGKLKDAAPDNEKKKALHRKNTTSVTTSKQNVKEPEVSNEVEGTSPKSMTIKRIQQLLHKTAIRRPRCKRSRLTLRKNARRWRQRRLMKKTEQKQKAIESDVSSETQETSAEPVVLKQRGRNQKHSSDEDKTYKARSRARTSQPRLKMRTFSNVVGRTYKKTTIRLSKSDGATPKPAETTDEPVVTESRRAPDSPQLDYGNERWEPKSFQPFIRRADRTRPKKFKSDTDESDPQVQVQSHIERALPSLSAPTYDAPLILDNGAYTLKMGYSCDNGPRMIPNAMMKVKSEKKRLFISNQIDECRDLSGMYFLLPCERGYITKWEVQKPIWDYVLNKGVAVEDRYVVMTQPHFNFKTIQDGIDEIFFEDYEVKGMYRASPTDFSRHEYCTHVSGVDEACMVVDTGFSFTHIVPYIDGKKYYKGLKRINIGGKFLTNYLRDIISYRMYDVMEETYVINQVKEDCLYVSMNVREELKKAKLPARRNPILINYVLPDFNMIRRGYIQNMNEKDEIAENCQILRLNNERFTVPELLFHPRDAGMSSCGVAEAVATTILSAPKSARKTLAKNLILTGGNVRIPGFQERFEADVRSFLPLSYVVKTYKPEDPITFAWKGAKSIVQDPHFKELVVTKQEYEEHGSKITYERFNSWASAPEDEIPKRTELEPLSYCEFIKKSNFFSKEDEPPVVVEDVTPPFVEDPGEGPSTRLDPVPVFEEKTASPEGSLAVVDDPMDDASKTGSDVQVDKAAEVPNEQKTEDDAAARKEEDELAEYEALIECTRTYI